MKKILWAIVATLGITLVMAVNAMAYLDPSAMTFIIQVFAGIAITCGAAFAIYRRRIMLFFKKRFGKKNTKQTFIDDDDEEDGTEA